ncbi:TIR domain-containing adapter molecule 1 isoform X2 [Tiliqua scincoides]|uniref:TIR domain-containing adapter molecule 1 isoform X2 n=1 Tax=Tiliqua scincoides TaxID=71010 RepID=UPI003461E9ED
MSHYSQCGLLPDSPVVPPPTKGSLSTDLQCDERQFFSFVVLHAGEDEAIACRVKDRLEDMGVSNGATFSENFLVPGHCQLSCFQNALDNSAFTLLLLTENFKCRICTYQTSVALMDSFTRFLKTNSVIPFVPKENPIKRGEMPTLLSALVPLDENSRVFATKVKKTFTSDVIEEKRREWNYMQEIQKRKRLQEQYHNYLFMAQRLSEINIAGCPTQIPFPLPQMGFPGLQHVPPGHIPEQFFRPTFSAPEMPQTQPVPAQPFLSQPFSFSLGPTSLTPGVPQPHLIIQNAQMVQIGDYNQMQVERTNTALGAADKEVDRNQVLERERAGDRTEE